MLRTCQHRDTSICEPGIALTDVYFVFRSTSLRHLTAMYLKLQKKGSPEFLYRPEPFAVSLVSSRNQAPLRHIKGVKVSLRFVEESHCGNYRST